MALLQISEPGQAPDPHARGVAGGAGGLENRPVTIRLAEPEAIVQAVFKALNP